MICDSSFLLVLVHRFFIHRMHTHCIWLVLHQWIKHFYSEFKYPLFSGHSTLPSLQEQQFLMPSNPQLTLQLKLSILRTQRAILSRIMTFLMPLLLLGNHPILKLPETTSTSHSQTPALEPFKLSVVP